MTNALRYNDVNTPRQSLERARIKILKGPDLGSVFVISGEMVTMGRGEENDIILRDLKASRRHAQIYWAGRIWEVKDLGSVNGIRVNQKDFQSSSHTQIKSGDLIAFGETEFQFFTADTPTQILRLPVQEALKGLQNQKSQSVFQQNRLEGILNIPKGGLNKKPTVWVGLIIFVLVAVFVFDIGALFESKTVKKNPSEKQDLTERPALESPVDYAEFLPNESVEQLKLSSSPFYKSGFREFREGNYLRARQYFETALQINPADRQARAHLEDTVKAVDDQIKALLMSAKNAIEAGRKLEARVNCNTVKRLLAFETDHKFYLQATKCLDEVGKIKGGR